MTPGHVLLALAVAAVWGANFVLIAIGLRELPPVLFCALRYTACALPLVFFLPRPKVDPKLLVAYAAVQFVGQFVLLFSAIAVGLPAGLASLLVQTQAFFTMLLAVPLHGERPHRLQWGGAAVALAGVGAIGTHLPGDAPVLGVVLVLCAALSWAIGNLLTKRLGHAEPKALVAWASLVAAPVLFAGSLAFEGPQRVGAALGAISPTGIGVVLANAYAATLFGYGAWSLLLRRYPAATVAPFSLLVPLFGIACTAWWLDEQLDGWTALAAALVLAGLALNLLGARKRSAAIRSAASPSPS